LILPGTKCGDSWTLINRGAPKLFGMGMKAKPLEGDMVETVDGVIFDVRGHTHPPGRVIAYPKYVPDLRGNLRRGKTTFRRIRTFQDLHDAIEQLDSKYLVHDLVFGEKLCEVPEEDIKYHYRPNDCISELRRKKELDRVEKAALSFLQLMKTEAKVPWNKLGISGSILAKLHTISSDIDPVIYGSKNCRRVYASIGRLLEDGERGLEKLKEEDYKKEIRSRELDRSAVSYEDYMRVEKRKIFVGRFGGRKYSIKFVKDWNEVESTYGMVKCTPKGYARIKAEIEDDSDAIFMPSFYKICNVELLEEPAFEPVEILSVHLRFCEQAKKGETIIARGKLELVQRRSGDKYHRLVIGNEASDYMILA